jgi:hypothetical protein
VRAGHRVAALDHRVSQRQREMIITVEHKQYLIFVWLQWIIFLIKVREMQSVHACSTF